MRLYKSFFVHSYTPNWLSAVAPPECLPQSQQLSCCGTLAHPVAAKVLAFPGFNSKAKTQVPVANKNFKTEQPPQLRVASVEAVAYTSQPT